MYFTLYIFTKKDEQKCIHICTFIGSLHINSVELSAVYRS